jgi:hypothetical protein
MATDAHYIPLRDVDDEQDGEAVWKGKFLYLLTWAKT